MNKDQKQKDAQDKHVFLGKLVFRMLVADALLDQDKSYSRLIVECTSKWARYSSRELYLKIAIDYKNEGIETVKDRINTGVYLINL